MKAGMEIAVAEINAGGEVFELAPGYERPSIATSGRYPPPTLSGLCRIHAMPNE